MVEKKRARRFFLLFIVTVLLAALFVLLPLVPQPSLKNRLTGEFSKALQQPCQVLEVRLKLLPRPAIAVQGLACNAPGFVLKARSLDLEFSFLSLLSFSPRIAGIHLRGVLAEIPFAALYSESGGNGEVALFLPELLKSIFKDKGQAPTLLSLHDAVCKVTKIPGLKKPQFFTDLDAKWRSQPRNQGETLELTGALNGGRGRLRVTWYNVDEEGAQEDVSADTDAGDRLEIACRLQGVSLPESEAVFWGAPESCWQADFEKGDLEFDINGDPEAGLLFNGKVAVVDHHLSRYEASPNRDSARLWSRGALKANFSGFFQRRKGYLNIKNAFLEYPGAATLFSRGLIRFREPLFVDLVNHLKVDDLSRTISNCFPLLLSGYQCEGGLEGDLKLVGNPLLAPVLKVELNSEKIILREALSAPTSLVPESGLETTFEAAVNGRSASSSYKDMTTNFLRPLAKWEWIVKSDCRIALLELLDLHLAELSFRAEKNLVQFEIERLAARFGKQGQVRLSLILDDLLHDPRWQASLVAEKLDLKPFSKNLSLTGRLDASMVGGGRLGADSGSSEELVLNGKWRLRQGSFAEQPLFKAFNGFLEQKRGAVMAAEFSDFSGKVRLRNKILRLDDLKLRSSASQLQAKGRFFTVDERLDFSGQYSKGSSFLQSFYLVGDLENPIFKVDRYQ